MTTQGSITVVGYVTALPRSSDEQQARVAVVQDGVEYRIIPRGAGGDLDDHLSAQVEVKGIVTEEDDVRRLQVRGYRVLEDDSWLDDE